MPKVLYVNIDEGASDKLAAVLDEREFTVVPVPPGEVAALVATEAPDLVLMACNRLGEAVRRLCSALRQTSGIPVVVCSSTARESDIVAIYDAGVDDYLMTPVRPVELVARLRAVLRRAGDSPSRQAVPETIRAGDLEVRSSERRALLRGHVVELSPIEFRLLSVLVSEVGRPVSHSRLIASVWGPEYVDCRNYLRLYVKYLRDKLEDDPRDPKLIISEWGVGYRLEAAGSGPAPLQTAPQPIF